MKLTKRYLDAEYKINIHTQYTYTNYTMKLKSATLLAIIGSVLLMVIRIWNVIQSIRFSIKYPDVEYLGVVFANILEVIAMTLLFIFFITLYKKQR